jgi:protein HIRA/HIR1
MPSLLLPDRVAFLVSGKDDSSLLIVTKDYTLLVWNVAVGKETCTLKADCTPLVRSSARSGVALAAVRLSTSGAPIFTFTNGHAYVYHSDLQTWARVADHSFMRSEFTSRLRQPGSSGFGIVQELQIAAARAATHLGPATLLDTTGLAPRRETGRHLEILVAGAALLKSAAEFKAWLAAYVRHLATECGDDPSTTFVGAESQLREVCTEFLGPLSASISVDTWASEILGIKKRTLLREVIIPTIAANGNAQRLVAEVVELLEAAEQREKDATKV